MLLLLCDALNAGKNKTKTHGMGKARDILVKTFHPEPLEVVYY